jgi:hypothetical protein
MERALQSASDKFHPSPREPISDKIHFMETPVNLEETPGKTVGRRKPALNTLDPNTHRKADAAAWRNAFRNGGLPKGVYKFHSHEEADAWTWKMLTRNTKS